MVHPLAVSLARSDVRFRLPEFERLKAAYSDPDLAIPEAVVKDRVTRLLERMAHEKRLKSTDPVPDIVARIFPSPGVIDEAAFDAAVDVGDRRNLYKSVLEAFTTVKPSDRPALRSAMKDAADLIQKVEGDDAGLTKVFGGKKAEAKTNYGKARSALGTLQSKISTKVTTDYNLDAMEIGLGGWASFKEQEVHLTSAVAQVTDPKKTQITLIHEAAHLADRTINDRGYYGSANFEALDEDVKLGNAAHYEELPRRAQGTSKFPGKTFTPGVLASGSAPTREDDVRRMASEFLRMAWDAAVDTHVFFRDLRKSYLQQGHWAFRKHRTVIMELSKLMDLSIHEQAGTVNVVTMLDVSLTESIARGVSLTRQELPSVTFPAAPGAKTDTEIRDDMVDAAVARYGNLLRDKARDRKLLEWFEAHYHNVPSV